MLCVCQGWVGSSLRLMRGRWLCGHLPAGGDSLASALPQSTDVPPLPAPRVPDGPSWCSARSQDGFCLDSTGSGPGTPLNSGRPLAMQPLHRVEGFIVRLDLILVQAAKQKYCGDRKSVV